jgi:apolipoprotein N-acyltransferase
LKDPVSPNSKLVTQNSKLSVLLPILSGILLVLCQPPVSLFPLAFVALIPLLYAMEKCSYRHPFIPGFITGIVAYVGLIYWVVVAMNSYGGIDIFTSTLILLLFVLYISLYIGCFTAAISIIEKRMSVPIYLSAPIIWALLEYLRGVALTGFPWSFLAHSQHNFLTFIQIASITGTYFISFLIAAINCIVFFMAFKKSISKVYIIAILIMVTASVVYGLVRLQVSQEGRLTAAIVQGNIRQDVKWDNNFKIKTIQAYYQNTIKYGSNVDFVVWPETALPLVFNEEVYVNQHIKALPPMVNSHLLFGTIWKDRSGKLYNSSYVIGKNGDVNGIYNKAHLVPFGEYTPLVRYLPFLQKITAQGAGFVPGEGHDPIITSLGKVGILICYEGVFPYITNATVAKGAQFLVNLTNDAWYERTSAAYQHLAFYVFRAVETDRYILRAANTGISAIIDPRGHITARTPIFEERVLKGNFALRDTLTFYVRNGDYFILISLLFLLAVIAIQFFRRKKAGNTLTSKNIEAKLALD